jgi:hypothetical protein
VTLLAHFDGKVIIAKKPLDLPTNALLELKIRPIAQRKRGAPKKRHGIPLARNDGVKMTAQQVSSMLEKV